MSTCPNGHQSESDDWCEVCGHRMAGAVPPPPPPPPMPGSGPPGGPPGPPQGGYGYPQQPQPPQQHAPPAPYSPDAPYQPQAPYSPGNSHAELCPQCRTPREAMAPFCEECRYNFLTHTPTTFAPAPPSQPQPQPQPQPGQSLLPPAFQQPPHTQPPHTQPPQNYDYQSSRPSQMNRPAEPLVPEQASAQQQTAPPPSPHAPYPPQQQPDPFQPHPPQQGQQGQQPGPRYDGDWTLPPPSAPQPQELPAAPGAPAGDWVAVVAPDREYFTAMMTRSGPEAAGLNLPAYSPEQQLRLTGPQMTIGRRRHSTGESPDIDLSRPPEDPGVSHQHAMLVQQPGGGWSVVDQDSTNGTTINGAEEPIQPFVPVPLQEGDRVHVGAWTTITVRRG